MNSTPESPREPGSFEYPDEAGYPDGMGTLDEGTGGTDSNDETVSSGLEDDEDDEDDDEDEDDEDEDEDEDDDDDDDEDDIS